MPRLKKIELLQLFSNAVRIGDIETMTQKEIDKLSPKLRKIFQQQYDIFHEHYPDEEPAHLAEQKTGGSPLLSQLATVAAASIALDRAFSQTEKKFRDTLIEHTERITEKASEKIQKQFEPVIKAIEAKEPEPIKASIGTEWDYANPKQHQYLEDRAAKMVTAIDDVTRQDVKDIIVKGHAESKSYSAIAKDIRDKYEEFSTPKPQGHIKDRAELIAVTELAHAAQATGYEESMALADDGWEVEKLWNNTGDDKVSDGCLENTDAGWIPIDEEFPSGDQYPPRFPGCRCCLSFNVVGRKKE